MTDRKKVIVAMSGGVDSSVTAALLLEQGYDVSGVTMQTRDPARVGNGDETAGCRSLAAVEDAGSVAAGLGIPHYVINFHDIFEEKVISYFTGEYMRGRTPNPCVVCNKHVKFAALLERALGLGADYMATGHYARLGFSEKYGRFAVRRPVDRKKDQTYVLYGLTQYQLAHALMPLGEYTKDQVRELAADFGLRVADKPESQEICFVLDDNYRNFLREKMIEVKTGPFLNMQGEVIGEHKGIPFYTVGQRRGLGIATGERLYVIKIDPIHNAITLGPEEAILGSDLIAEDINLILYDQLDGPVELAAQIRYNGRPAPATVAPLPDGRLHVRLHTPLRSITPGQSVVFYQDDYLAGGGTIK